MDEVPQWTNAQASRKPAWGAVVSMALGVFGLVTAEFLPASLLTPMALDLGVSEGMAGQAVTATAAMENATLGQIEAEAMLAESQAEAAEAEKAAAEQALAAEKAELAAQDTSKSGRSDTAIAAAS